MSNQYTRKDVDKRREREERHRLRALQEQSENICQFPFIEELDIYFFKGKEDEVKDEFIIHFHLKYPVLLQHFRELIYNKLRGALIE